MLNCFRSFFALCMIMGALGLFLVTMVQVLSDSRPVYSGLPAAGILLNKAT